MPGGTLNVVGGFRSADTSPRGDFTASRRLVTLEHFRTPYSVCESRENRDFEWLLAPSGGPAILWPARLARHGRPVAGLLQVTDYVGVLLVGRILPDSLTTELLPDRGTNWRPTAAVVLVDGERVASIWRADDGSILLPFDPDEVRLTYLSERYQELMAPASARAWRRM